MSEGPDRHLTYEDHLYIDESLLTMETVLGMLRDYLVTDLDPAEVSSRMELIIDGGQRAFEEARERLGET